MGTGWSAKAGAETGAPAGTLSGTEVPPANRWSGD
jgi:hypothetical protein